MGTGNAPADQAFPFPSRNEETGREGRKPPRSLHNRAPVGGHFLVADSALFIPSSLAPARAASGLVRSGANGRRHLLLVVYGSYRFESAGYFYDPRGLSAGAATCRPYTVSARRFVFRSGARSAVHAGTHEAVEWRGGTGAQRLPEPRRGKGRVGDAPASAGRAPRIRASRTPRVGGAREGAGRRRAPVPQYRSGRAPRGPAAGASGARPGEATCVCGHRRLGPGTHSPYACAFLPRQRRAFLHRGTRDRLRRFLPIGSCASTRNTPWLATTRRQLPLRIGRPRRASAACRV